jgi:hypothetical protein
MKEIKRTVDVYDADRENYFSIVWLVLSVCSGRDGRGQIIRKPEFLACVMIR